MVMFRKNCFLVVVLLGVVECPHSDCSIVRTSDKFVCGAVKDDFPDKVVMASKFVYFLGSVVIVDSDHLVVSDAGDLVLVHPDGASEKSFFVWNY